MDTKIKASNIYIRILALATFSLGIVSFLLSYLGKMSLNSTIGLPVLVIQQNLWNATQVGYLLLILCLVCAHHRLWVYMIACISGILLPFSIYIISPGGFVYAIIVLITSLLVIQSSTPKLYLYISDIKDSKALAAFRFEFLAFLCCLVSSMYNYNGNQSIWPYWKSIYLGIDDFFNIASDPAIIIKNFFTLGCNNEIPAYIPSVSGTTLGAIVFLFIWSIIPTLYVLYFIALFKMSNESYGTRIQKILCLFCIFHFLFLTDFVDYRFGRGIINQYAEWFHWSERISWRIAILLPLYQKVMTMNLKNNNGIIGIILHYVIAIWGILFFIYQVVIYDVTRIYYFLTNAEPSSLFLQMKKYYMPAFGYYGALVFMIFFYGFMILAMRCKYFIISSDTGRNRLMW